MAIDLYAMNFCADQNRQAVPAMNFPGAACAAQGSLLGAERRWHNGYVQV